MKGASIPGGFLLNLTSLSLAIRDSLNEQFKQSEIMYCFKIHRIYSMSFNYIFQSYVGDFFLN